MSDIPQARELIHEALSTCLVDEAGTKLLRKALRLMIRPARQPKPVKRLRKRASGSASGATHNMR